MTDSSQDKKQSDHSSPYPVSRLAPAFELVELAQEIAQADQMLANRANAQLAVIAEQVRVLQQQAREILQQTRHHQQLHRAHCNFQKKPGQIYHLYQNKRGESLLSMLSPEDWRGRPPNDYLGSFRLESDCSWTALEKLQQAQEQDPLQAIQALLQSTAE
jgi:hypothetical protein